MLPRVFTHSNEKEKKNSLQKKKNPKKHLPSTEATPPHKQPCLAILKRKKKCFTRARRINRTFVNRLCI